MDEDEYFDTPPPLKKELGEYFSIGAPPRIVSSLATCPLQYTKGQKSISYAAEGRRAGLMPHVTADFSHDGADV